MGNLPELWITCVRGEQTNTGLTPHAQLDCKSLTKLQTALGQTAIPPFFANCSHMFFTLPCFFAPSTWLVPPTPVF